MISMLTWMARSLCRNAGEHGYALFGEDVRWRIAAASGCARAFASGFEVTNCDLKLEVPFWRLKSSNSSLDNWNVKSSENGPDYA